MEDAALRGDGRVIEVAPVVPMFLTVALACCVVVTAWYEHKLLVFLVGAALGASAALLIVCK